MMFGKNKWKQEMSDMRHARVRLFLQYNLELNKNRKPFRLNMDTRQFTGTVWQSFPSRVDYGSAAQTIEWTLRSARHTCLNVTSKTHFALHSLQFPSTFTHFCCGSTRVKAPCTGHLWKSCLAGSKHWRASKKAAWKERRLMWLQGKRWVSHGFTQPRKIKKKLFVNWCWKPFQAMLLVCNLWRQTSCVTSKPMLLVCFLWKSTSCVASKPMLLVCYLWKPTSCAISKPTITQHENHMACS